MFLKNCVFLLIAVSCCLLAVFYYNSDLTNTYFKTEVAFHFLRNAQRVSLFDRQFSHFFEDEEVNAFRTQYVQRCSVCSTTGTLQAVLNGKTSGLGSVLNNAFNIILIAWEPSVNRHFTLVETPSLWSYAPLSTFFDYPTGSHCSVLVQATPDTQYTGVNETFGLFMDGRTKQVHLSGKSQETIKYFGDRWPQFRNVSEEILRRDGIEKVFRRKSALTRALWKFRLKYRILLEELWSEAVDLNGQYFAIHIRRTDKVLTKEMDNVPSAAYWQKLSAICAKLNSSCPRNVFVMYDEPSAFSELKETALNSKSAFKFTNYPILINSTGRDVREFVGLSPPALFTLKNGQLEWFKHTQEMLLSITLLAMSSQLICTFSSNVCRLAVLVRGNLNPETVHSLDAPTWHNL